MISYLWISIFILPLASYLLSSRIRNLITKYSQKGFLYVALMLIAIFLSRCVTLYFLGLFQSQAGVDNYLYYSESLIQFMMFFSSFSFWLFVSIFINRIYEIKNNDIALLIILNFGEITWFIVILSIVTVLTRINFY